MEAVEASRTIDASPEAVEDALSPRRIVEYEGTYQVREVERTGDGWDVVAGTSVSAGAGARAGSGAGDLDIDLEFTRTEAGYVYRQRDDRGPFGEMYSSVTVRGNGPVVATVRSCFTFDMPLSWIADRFARRERRTELRRLLDRLAAAVEEQ